VSWQWSDVRSVQTSCRATFSSTKTTLNLCVTSRREWLAPHRLTTLFHAALNLQINLVRQSLYMHVSQVTEGQPRVVLHLDRPAAARATIRVTAERADQLLPVEEVKLKNPHTVMVTLPVCLMAKSCLGKHLYCLVDSLLARHFLT
jgi:hypothetical protein